MAIYTTKRKGNDGRTYVGANIHNRQFEVKLPSAKKTIKKVGKFLDKQFIEPSRNYNKIQKEIDNKNRKKMEMERTGQVAMRKKGRNTSDGYMRG